MCPDLQKPDIIYSIFNILRNITLKTATVCMSGQDSRWEQFDTTYSLISAPHGQWHHKACNGLL